jgi:hypothetical protein
MDYILWFAALLSFITLAATFGILFSIKRLFANSSKTFWIFALGWSSLIFSGFYLLISPILPALNPIYIFFLSMMPILGFLLGIIGLVLIFRRENRKKMAVTLSAISVCAAIAIFIVPLIKESGTPIYCTGNLACSSLGSNWTCQSFTQPQNCTVFYGNPQNCTIHSQNTNNKTADTVHPGRCVSPPPPPMLQ